MTALYGAYLNLEGRRCVVVGGGAVAERKLGSLAGSGASTVVIAPVVTDGIRALAEAGACTLIERPYRRGDLAGAVLAFAATSDRAVNAEVLADARAAGVLVNSVDDPGRGDFSVPATVRRGDITVSISTGGRSPAFARQLREDLEDWLTPARVRLLDLLAEVRREIRAGGSRPPAEAWRRAVDRDVLLAIEAGDRPAARARLLEALAAPSAAAGL